jgi:hypothetical protein
MHCSINIAPAFILTLLCCQLHIYDSIERRKLMYSTEQEPSNSMKLKITVGSSVFTATLQENTTTAAFKAMLPLTTNMTELNGNEKYYNLSADLPARATAIGAIKAGDIMLYGKNCLVLFYESFTTSYPYTPLGHIDNISGLAAALGNEAVTVRLELL